MAAVEPKEAASAFLTECLLECLLKACASRIRSAAAAADCGRQSIVSGIVSRERKTTGFTQGGHGRFAAESLKQQNIKSV